MPSEQTFTPKLAKTFRITADNSRMTSSRIEGTQAESLLQLTAPSVSPLDRLLAAREETRRALRHDFMRLEALMAELAGLLAVNAPTGQGEPNG